MNKTFRSPEEFNDFMKATLKFSPAKQKDAVKLALTEMCVFLEKAAKDKFGHYQDGWDELAEATKKDRLAKGYTENDPLYRDGTLKDSVKHTVIGNKGFVGSTSEIMVYQEKGTTSTGWSSKGIPPRPVFLITQVNEGAAAVSIFFKTFMQLFRGRV